MTEAAADVRTVTVEREFAHPPERVWRALTQPHLIAEWLMKTDFAPELGHRFRLTGDWGGVDCEILEIEPHERLSYSWNHPHEDPAYNLLSIVTFTLEPTGTGTRLRMEQKGFRPEQKQALGGAKFGWQQHFTDLEQVLVRLDLTGEQR